MREVLVVFPSLLAMAGGSCCWEEKEREKVQDNLWPRINEMQWNIHPLNKRTLHLANDLSERLWYTHRTLTQQTHFSATARRKRRIKVNHAFHWWLSVMGKFTYEKRRQDQVNRLNFLRLLDLLLSPSELCQWLTRHFFPNSVMKRATGQRGGWRNTEQLAVTDETQVARCKVNYFNFRWPKGESQEPMDTV